MGPAAFRGALLALACVFAACSQAADRTSRATPSRPSASATPAATRRFGGADYISLPSVAGELGLKFSWADPGRKAVLSGPAARAIIEVDTRDIVVNGLRVFLGDPVTDVGGQLFVSRIDFERCLAPMLRPGFRTVAPSVPQTIVIDPGHGGRDEGTENKKLGLKEKVLTLDVAQRLKRLLEAQGYRVLLTRTTDRELSPKKDQDLPQRAEIANRAHADLFVSIHFNSAPNDTHGTEVYTYAPVRQHATVWWSELKKDDGDIETTAEPVNRFDHWSVVLAQSLHRQLLQTLKTEDRGKKIAHWAVLKNLECPGVLVEPAILSSEAEARRVATPEFREKIAEALAAGIREYTGTVTSVRTTTANGSATSKRRRSSRSSHETPSASPRGQHGRGSYARPAGVGL